MKQIAFYITIAFLTFGIGSFTVYKFYFNIKNSPVNVQETIIKTPTKIEQNSNFIRYTFATRKISQNGEKTAVIKSKTDITCKNKILSAVINDLKKEKKFKEFVKSYIEENNPLDCRDILFIEKYTNLNKNGGKEVIVRGKMLMCGATGNCSIWIYKKSRKSYRKILESNGEALEIKNNSTKGYQNIFIRVRASCCSFYLLTYKFNGINKYKENKCLFEDYGTTGVRKIMICEEKEES